MKPFRNRLRVRLLSVALIAAAPAMAAIVVTQSIARQRARELTLADNLRLVRLAADRQASLFDGARLLLLTLAEVPGMRASDPRACEEMLPNVLRSHPGYLTLAVANADGTLFCSAAPPDRRLLANARGRVWFERVMRDRTTATGDYQFSAASGVPAIVVAHPLLDSAGRVSRILVATIDLSELKNTMSRADLPPGGTLTLIDHAGTILARVPGGDSWVGRQVPGALPAESAALASDRTNETEGIDGVRRLYVSVPVRAAVATGINLSLGVDTAAAFRESDRIYRGYLWLLGIVSILGVGAAAIGGHLFVLRPVKALKAVTDRIAAGDLSARARLADSVGGVSELGDAVNAMAGALDSRERERERAEGERAERAALTTVLAEVGAVLNRSGDLRAGMRGCAEAIVAHLDVAAVEIWLHHPTSGVLEAAAAAGDRIDDDARHRLEAGRWPLVVRDRDLGEMTVFSRQPLTEGTVAGLASVSAMIALGVTRHQSESARRLLDAIVASSDEAIYGIATDGTVMSWNAGAERLFGYPSGEIVGGPVSQLYPPDRAAELPELMARINRGERVLDLETVRARHDGSLVAVSLSLSPIRDAAGDVVGTSAIARDMTERRRSEERLHLLGRALESTNEMVSVTDADDRYTFVNAAFLRAYGYTADEVIGQTPALIQSEKTPDTVFREILRESRRDGWSGELLNRRRDGTEFFVSLNTSAVRGEHGEIAGLLGVARDITERLRVEGALRGAEERMRFALEASHVGVWEANLTTGTGFWSATCEAMHGLAPGVFRQTYEAFIEHVHPDDRAETRRQVTQAIRTRAPAEMEYRTLWPDGTVRRISFIAHFSFDEQGKPVRAAGVAIDVTEQRSLEDQLRQSQKMDAVGQLAGGIAHDFNNLLTVIQGCAGFLSEELAGSEQHLADVEEIQRAAERAAGLTRQLLAFSRKQILAVRVLHIGDIVGELTPMLRRLIGEPIDLRTSIGNRGLAKTDPGQLEQVIVNLVVNARDAMPQGGRLTIETSDVVLDEAFARRHPSVRPGPHVMLAVSDTGHGMDAATQKRVFEPFFTTKPMGQGTGLGLATVYGIVKQSGGTIWLDSEVGRGTTFKVYLPSTEDVEVIVAPVAIRPEGGTESVLLIEDEGPVREFVYRVLSRRGYAIHAVASPGKALEYAQAHLAPIDLVFSDVVLPDMSGRDLVTQIQQWHPESAVLFMSGYTDQAIVHEGVLDAGTAFLQKPFTADTLTKTVRDILDGRAGGPLTATRAGDRSSGIASGG